MMPKQLNWAKARAAPAAARTWKRIIIGRWLCEYIAGSRFEKIRENKVDEPLGHDAEATELEESQGGTASREDLETNGFFSCRF